MAPEAFHANKVEIESSKPTTPVLPDSYDVKVVLSPDRAGSKVLGEPDDRPYEPADTHHDVTIMEKVSVFSSTSSLVTMSYNIFSSPYAQNKLERLSLTTFISLVWNL